MGPAFDSRLMQIFFKLGLHVGPKFEKGKVQFFRTVSRRLVRSFGRPLLPIMNLPLTENIYAHLTEGHRFIWAVR